MSSVSEVSPSEKPTKKQRGGKQSEKEDEFESGWEQEYVKDMLADKDIDSDSDVEEAKDEEPKRGDGSVDRDAEDVAVELGEAALASSEGSVVSSDITDPFEEFHSHGALQTEESQPLPTRQPPASRRTQFLRAVSLFSPAHQLAIMEARDEQGVSLLELSTCLTAEPLDELGKMTLTGSGTQDKAGVGAAMPTCRESARQSFAGEDEEAPARSSPRTPREHDEPAAEPEAGLLPGAEAQAEGGGEVLAPREGGISEGGSRGTSPADLEPPFPGADPNMDGALAALLRELWTDPRATPQSEEDAARAQSRGSRRASRAEVDWPDMLSGVWRMLDTYEEFVCSPPGFNAFRQEKPHWLEQEPIPWPVMENAREKCSRWLQTCPIPA